MLPLNATELLTLSNVALILNKLTSVLFCKSAELLTLFHPSATLVKTVPLFERLKKVLKNGLPVKFCAVEKNGLKKLFEVRLLTVLNESATLLNKLKNVVFVDLTKDEFTSEPPR